MDPRRLIAHLVLIGVLAAGVLALALTTRVEGTDRAGIVLELPDTVGLWKGDEIRYCQNPECREIFRLSQLEDRNTCPTCGGELSGGSLIEWGLLPGDTRILKKLYTHPVQSQVLVSIVIGGASRTSIHRPQICLVGDGREIVGTHALDIPLENRDELSVTLLDLLYRKLQPDGSWLANASYYAYWFISPDHETPSHYERMFWMAYDQIFHGQIHRWAYLSVSGQRRPGNDQYREQVQSFLAELYPRLERTPKNDGLQ